MDWAFAIERNRGQLLGLVAGLFVLIGLTEGSAVERLSRPIYWLVLRALRPAESAVRRLIIVMARDIVVKPPSKRPFPKGRVIKRKSSGEGQSQGRAPSFKLFDPPKRSNAGNRRRRHAGPKVEPRIRVIDVSFDPRIPWFLRSHSAPTAPAPAPREEGIVDDGTVGARRLCRRLFAIVRALEDLSREARRLARWWARPIEERRPRREAPLRLGWPPGWRIRSTHEVDEILKECHWLVRSLPASDTS